MLLFDKIKKKHYFFIKKLCIPIFLLTFPKQIKEREETQKDKSVARWGGRGGLVVVGLQICLKHGTFCLMHFCLMQISFSFLLWRDDILVGLKEKVVF